MLDFERLHAYQCALQFATIGFEIVEGLPRGHAQLGDQLKRAAISIPLNIAEGAGKATERDRRRYFSIARGSAMECAAVIDILRIQGCVDDATSARAKRLLERVVAMLSKMAR